MYTGYWAWVAAINRALDVSVLYSNKHKIMIKTIVLSQGHSAKYTVHQADIPVH